MAEYIPHLIGWDAIALTEKGLDGADAFTNSDRRWLFVRALDLGQALLEVRGSGQVVGVRVCLEDPGDGVTFGSDQGE